MKKIIILAIALNSSLVFAESKKLEVTLSDRSEETAREVQSAAADTGAMGAEVIRDAQGKVEKVVVNFNDSVDNKGINNAVIKISNNNGVATVVTLPLGGEAPNSFDSYLDGQDLTGQTIDAGGVDVSVSGLKITSNGIDGNSLIMRDYSYAELLISPSENNLSTIQSFEMELDTKIINPTGRPYNISFTGLYPLTATLSINSDGSMAYLRMSQSGSGYVYLAPSTPVNFFTTQHLKVAVNELGGVQLSIGSNSFSHNMGVNFSASWGAVGIVAVIAGYETDTDRFIFDNITAKILK